MKSSLVPVLTLLVGVPALANEALDVLEGRTEAADVVLPPAPEGSPSAVLVPEKPVVFTPAEWSASPMDPIWARAVLFEDESNPWVQQLAIMGMFQFNASWGTAEVDLAPNVNLDTARTRRARLGARIRAFGNTEIEMVGEFAGDGDYSRIERLKAKTQLTQNHSISYGKMKPQFGVEQSKDPSQLLTPERSLFANMMSPAESLGVMFTQDCLPWDWGIGWFSGDADRYIPGIEGAGYFVGNLAYESAERLEGGNAMRTRWHLDYIYNMDGGGSEAIPRYDVRGRYSANGLQRIYRNPAFRHMVSTGVEVETERWAMESDFMIANGDVNAWGLTLTPSYWVIPGTLKMVARYHYADTDEARGLVGGLGVSSDPYFSDGPTFAGDEFHSFYLGANFHLYQDKVVILNGVEYAIMKDESGADFDLDAWIWHSGARISF